MNKPWSSAVMLCGRSFLVSGGALLLSIGNASAAGCYDFKLLTDTRDNNDDQLAAIGRFVSLNDEGTVAFKADMDFGGTRVFVGPLFNTLFEVSPNVTPTSAFGGTSINDVEGDPVVAFQARFDAQNNGVWTGSAFGNVNSIYRGSALSFPSINNAGLVALSTTDTILVGDGGSLTALATVGDGVTFFGDPMINDAMTVVVVAVLDGGQAIVTVDGRTTNVVADTTGRFDRFAVFPVINDDNVVAFFAGLDNGSTGIFEAANGEVETVVNSHGAYESFGGFISLNNHGEVAFKAVTDDGIEGIFTGANPTAHKVVTLGDALFGSSVTELDFYREGLNDAGQVAFVATLADGTQSLVRADPVDRTASSCP
jgi:hypothetical protein